ncbi:hypothetical protein DDT46_10630 [Mycobacteroides abscessus]|uniref:hypothetical protein n=1 Tax=Mycobacteroides abscessus TaxID=36809 RepID=UPI000D52FBE1|nr:hypothetical protein [Mycobacteroides abscessus]AWG64206.1 hypothetical protein DDT46_10630 [Mycobacteroides abscessus]
MIAADTALGIVFGLAAGFLRGAAASVATVCRRLADQHDRFPAGDGSDEWIGLEELIATASDGELVAMADQHTAVLLVAAADWISDKLDELAGGEGVYPRLVIDLRNRAAALRREGVSREELATHIWGVSHLSPHVIASSLLADYRITKK